MFRAKSRATIDVAIRPFTMLCLLLPLGTSSADPVDRPENTATAAVRSEPSDASPTLAPERLVVGRLVLIEGTIEFRDRPEGRHGVTKNEAYVIQDDSGRQVRVVLHEDTHVEAQVDVGDRVLTVFDEHGKPTTIQEIRP